MTFAESLRTVLTEKYATFTGRASRSEYWWFQLAMILTFVVLAFAVGGPDEGFGIGTILFVVVVLAVLIPSIAVTVRRLHDTDRSGWWVLLNLIPYVGALILLVFTVLKGTSGDNRFGAEPADVAAAPAGTPA